jgi:hypothetical protein
MKGHFITVVVETPGGPSIHRYDIASTINEVIQEKFDDGYIFHNSIVLSQDKVILIFRKTE